jgi:hypothetical protein
MCVYSGKEEPLTTLASEADRVSMRRVKTYHSPAPVNQEPIFLVV